MNSNFLVVQKKKKKIRKHATPVDFEFTTFDVLFANWIEKWG